MLPIKDSVGDCTAKQGEKGDFLFLNSTGFSIVEVLMVIAFASILAGIAALSMDSIRPGMDANQALYQTISQLRSGRQMAISQRRDILVQLIGNNQIQLVRRELNNTGTVLKTIFLARNFQFMKFDEIDETPEDLGVGSSEHYGNETLILLFLSDGTLVDQTGAPKNLTIFLGSPDHPEVARAVTVLGTTGRIRGYRWNSTESAWIE
jgi:Tfp pilus assembly protein FimT